MLVEHPPQDTEDGEKDSAILQPDSRALLHWLHGEGALPIPRELRDPVTGLWSQEALEGELLGTGLAARDTFIQLTDSAYTSARFIEQEHRPIKWGPDHGGKSMGARIMAVNEFYGFDAGSEAIQLVAAAVLFLDDVQHEMNAALKPGLCVRLKAVRIQGEHVARGAEVLDMVDPLRSLEETVDLDESRRERQEPGTGNVLASHDIPPSDTARRGAFQAASARFLEAQARESADELLRVYRDRGPDTWAASATEDTTAGAWTVVIGGSHGAGKNTLAERLTRAAGLTAYNVGDLKRRMAAVRGFPSVQRYGTSLDADAARELDAFLDGLQAERVLQGGALLHSFFGPWVAAKLAPELARRGGRLLRVLLTCPLEERARRVQTRHAEGDDPGTVEETHARLRARDAADLANLAKLAGSADAEALLHPGRYDLVFDTSALSADELAARVLERLAADA
ncbi:AAA family ATPase [Corallococcus sp. M34]|uniref:AAA family ATPase n=1 Tax=Citreicoccus inhibens TaxID=2849499 RepID=UPI001C250224|nr:AAA family ATPase [Citreicoccus inhibens]MBU8898004.1 AAA family ATPase [Citreicoccus inhibens]